MRKSLITTLLLTLILTACSSVTTNIANSSSTQFNTQAKYGIVTFTNHTITPMAGKKATGMTSTIIHSLGINHFVTFHPQSLSIKDLATENNSAAGGVATSNATAEIYQQPTRKQILTWAKKENIDYLITGSVNEWRYKVGLDGEPVASISLHIIRVSDNKIIASATGSKRGSARSALGAVGQSLIEQLLEEMLR